MIGIILTAALSMTTVPAKPEAIQVANTLAHTINGRTSKIQGISMVPAITSKDIVVYNTINWDDIKIGDIIVFNATICPSGVCTKEIYAHRVVVKTSKYLHTKGDHNIGMDDWVTYPQDVIGHIVYVVDGQTGEVR